MLTGVAATARRLSYDERDALRRLIDDRRRSVLLEEERARIDAAKQRRRSSRQPQRQPHTSRTDPDGLTRRERSVVTLRDEGRTTDEIAAELGLSPGTIAGHASRARKKLRRRLQV